LLSIASAASAIAIASPALAQSGQPTQAGAPAARNGVRLGAPAGSYIADRLKHADLDNGRAVTHEHEGKKITFIPARITESLDEAAQGHVLGVLETEVEGGETGLPPGRYTIFAKSVGGEWEAFAEVDGVVAKQALQVIADDVNAPKDRRRGGKPQFSTTDAGWCWTTGPYPAPSSWGRYDFRGYWHFYPTEWGLHQALTVCW
ncbi:MAG: hypothetical protein ABR499_14290, partial [Gemmatimonadaceae bacterium]